MRAFAVLLLAGCWTGDEPAPRTPANPPPPVVVAPAPKQAAPEPPPPPPAAPTPAKRRPIAQAPSARAPDPTNGKRLYEWKGCNVCHALDGTVRIGPSWKGIWGTKVLLEDGRTVVVDAVYVRRSILDSQADIVVGFPRAMPRFAGQISDEEVADLIAFIESLK